jgi:5-methyltetrahydrofolate corrinoid/iron sulfur protein methyltransferase
VDLPLCLDSAHPPALAAVAGSVRQGLLLNSASGERERLDALIPLAARLGAALLCLALDERGIPAGADRRLEVLSMQVQEARRAGIPDEKLFLDPLVLTVATDTSGPGTTLEVIRGLRREFPEAHVCTAVSNVSFGLPGRTLLNRAFLTLALAGGLDAAILNPLDRELRGALLATQTLLGRDRFCRAYTTSFRRGVIGT